MDRRYDRQNFQNSDNSPPSEAWLFAQAIQGKPMPNATSAAAHARAKREFDEFVASISPQYKRRLQDEQAARAAATADRELLQWAAQISPRAQRQLEQLLAAEAQARESQRRAEAFLEALHAQEAYWDPSKHPRLGHKPNAGWFASKSGTVSSNGSVPGGGPFQSVGYKRGGQADASGGGNDSLTRNTITGRNAALLQAAGEPIPRVAGSNRAIADLHSEVRLPGEVGREAAAGLGTGAKAVVNSAATAIKNVATLGLSSSQLELIGVTKADRARGYDAAAAIATASGEVLIAVGSGGIASVLSKGGTVARATGGALVVYDAAGNAVGVVKGTYDAATNGITLQNGAQIAAGAIGLGVNVQAARGLRSPAKTKSPAPSPVTNVDDYVSKLPRKSTPRTTPANQYEIAHTGPYNYTVSGGGVSFDIDGYRGTTILETKHVQQPLQSPFVPGSSCPESVRTEILAQVRDELQRVRTIIDSGSTPFTSVEIITNSPAAQTFFETLLNEMRVPGTVRLQP